MFWFIHVAGAIWLAVFCPNAAMAQPAGGATEPHHQVVPLTLLTPGGVVSGDPGKPGAPFVLRIRNLANQVVPVHWHPEDEHLTVVKGTWYLGSGDKFDRNGLKEMNVGDYAFMPKQMRHFGWSKTETIVQVHGIGPFKVIPYGTWELSSGWRMTEQGMIKYEKAASSFKFKSNDRVRYKGGVGIVLAGVRSMNDDITQYVIQMENGTKAFEFEEDLSAVARKTQHPGILNGKWACVSGGLPQGDLESTMYVDHDGTKVVGVVTFASDGGAFSFTTPDAKEVGFSIDSIGGKITFEAKYERGELAGKWRAAFGQGSWTCKNSASDQ